MKKAIIMLVLLMACLYCSKGAYSETLENMTIEQKKDNINKLAVKYEEVCDNGGKIAAAELSGELVKYGDLAIPVFEKIIIKDSFEAFFFSVQGLKNISSDGSIEVLINTYQSFTNNKKYFSRIKDIIFALGEIDNQKADSFLKEILNSNIEYAKIFAAQMLYQKERNLQAENTLIDLAPKYMEALGAINKTPKIVVSRKEDLIIICENVLKASRDDFMLLNAIGILAQIGDQKSIALLTDYFKVSKNELILSTILNVLENVNTSLSRNAIINLNNAPNKSDFIKNKIKEKISKMK